MIYARCVKLRLPPQSACDEDRWSKAADLICKSRRDSAACATSRHFNCEASWRIGVNAIAVFLAANMLG